MKNKKSIITSCLALALAGSANAAGVFSSINWTDDSSLSFITSTNVTHSGEFRNSAQVSAATINGHTFESINIPGSNTNTDFFSNLTFPHTGSNFTVGATSGGSNFTFTGTAGVTGTASSRLSQGLIGFSNGAGVVTINLTGLTAHTNYEFYFFSPAWDGLTPARVGTLDGSDDGVGNTFAEVQTGGSGDNIVKYAYNTGASTTFTMTATSTSGGLHYYGFVNVVPEPSTALLGGLGMLALLRRRR